MQLEEIVRGTRQLVGSVAVVSALIGDNRSAANEAVAAPEPTPTFSQWYQQDRFFQLGLFWHPISGPPDMSIRPAALSPIVKQAIEQYVAETRPDVDIVRGNLNTGILFGELGTTPEDLLEYGQGVNNALIAFGDYVGEDFLNVNFTAETLSANDPIQPLSTAHFYLVHSRYQSIRGSVTVMPSDPSDSRTSEVDIGRMLFPQPESRIATVGSVRFSPDAGYQMPANQSPAIVLPVGQGPAEAYIGFVAQYLHAHLLPITTHHLIESANSSWREHGSPRNFNHESFFRQMQQSWQHREEAVVHGLVESFMDRTQETHGIPLFETGNYQGRFAGVPYVKRVVDQRGPVYVLDMYKNNPEKLFGPIQVVGNQNKR